MIAETPLVVAGACVAGACVTSQATALRGALSRDAGAVLTLVVVAVGFWAQTHGHHCASACLLSGAGSLGVIFRVPAWIFEEGQ